MVTIFVFLPLFFLATSAYYLVPVQADEVEDLQKQIDELNHARELSVNATKPLEGQLESLNIQLKRIQINLQNLATNIAQKEKELKLREERVVVQQALLSSRVRAYYIRSFLTTPLLMIFAQPGSSGELLRDLSYRQAATREDQKIISRVSREMVTLMGEKDKLEKDKANLAAFQVQVDKNADFLAGEIDKAKVYQTDLSNRIAELTAKQQAILAAKSGNFTTSVGDVPLADDPNARPDFNPNFSPAFAMFSFGAYTHRNGMSQYGAKARAEAGQSTEQILAAYYPGANLNKSYSVPSTINVTGYGSMPFEDTYMKRIYEMPSDWPMDALKAQAVAARTYAIRSGGSICPTENCQVYKPSDKPDRWLQAVRETRGWVLEGGPNAQYSSTTGGYGNNSGWDTKCGSKDCWTAEAYEKLAGSPWFYKGWYRDRSGASCGRSHPWLTSEEMSDILNAWIVYQSGSDRDRISPVDTACWSGDPFSISEMKEKAGSSGGAVADISSVSVIYSGSGTTAEIIFSTNHGSIKLSGSDFKTIFNLRAPGYISIKSPLYNIEKK